jgi:phosphoglycolate phosphatase-like HAD superfamily hydrolase
MSLVSRMKYLLGESKSEVAEIETILKKHGYDPKDAVKLSKEGMGPEEVLHRIKSTKAGEKGSLEYTHGLKMVWEGQRTEAIRNQPLGQGVDAGEAMAEMMAQANALFKTRGSLRDIQTTIADGLDGYAAAIGPFSKAPQAVVNRIRELRKDIEEWDHLTGKVANGLEVVVRDLKKEGKS